MLAKKDLSVGWFCLVCGQQRGDGWGPFSLALKGTLSASEYSAYKQRGLGFRLQHGPFSPHKFPSFVLVEEDTLSPLGLEGLQTHNSVQTAHKNLTSLEQPQG